MIVLVLVWSSAAMVLSPTVLMTSVSTSDTVDTKVELTVRSTVDAPTSVTLGAMALAFSLT